MEQDNNSTTVAATTTDHDNNNNNNIEEKPFRLVPGGKIPNHGKVFARQFASLLVMLTIQVGIPLALYYGLRNKIGVVYALVISGIPPFLYVIVEFIRKRKVDMLGCIIGGSFIISGVISIVSGDERAALVRDSAVGAVVGFFFLLSLIPLNTKWLVIRPLTFIMGQQMFSEVYYRWTDRDGNPQQQNILAWQWEHIRYFRWSMRIQSALWSFVLFMQLVACVLFVEVTDMSVDDIVKYNNIITSVYTPVMITISISAGIYGVRFEKRIGKAWVEENDFTDKFEAQQQEQQRSGDDKEETQQRSIVDNDTDEDERDRRVANMA
ncbi:hypothetical protein BDA99DRAFT_429164 [Phascolomyces articulosus]|uniref:Uncharacterized protein n=1 Tax=Phascolomyces articulosus TaxID=60185 RepID=A0AAD5PMR3_9FUNG|nr:hypothetical protein BDA99DRAFT_429164 [Phascolomyces articulosus]